MTMSARARQRSRTASSAWLGTRTAVSCPARSNRARRRASRLSVFTLSPGAVGMREGAITSQRTPIAWSWRASS